MADVSGISELRSQISAGIARQREKIISDLDAIGAQMAEEIRSAAPKITGTLSASVRHEVVVAADGVRLKIIVGNDAAFYAPYMEFGTSRAPAHPFVRPVVHREEKKIPGRVASTVYAAWDFQ